VASFLSSLLGVLVATNQPSAVSNFVHEKTGATIEVVDPNDPIEVEYQRLLQLDDSAQREVDHWIKEDAQLATAGAGDSATLRLRIRQRFEPVEKAYQGFLERNPKHVKARIAFGSFLGDIGREDEAKVQYEKALEIDPTNAAALNDLAGYYGHSGPVTNAFACYEKAIALKPNESVYYHNLGLVVYLFRHDATNYFHISEQQVFDKAMMLYRKALSLDPENFPLATDLAQTYYGIQPPRIKEAFKAWEDALKIARDDIESEGVHVHFARWHRTAGDFKAARRELNLVTNKMYAVSKERILKSLETAESRTNGVSRPAANGK
jgi:tetratricopeptide (TPR) repeat protein